MHQMRVALLPWLCFLGINKPSWAGGRGQINLYFLPEGASDLTTTDIRLRHAAPVPQLRLTPEFFALLSGFSFRLRHVKDFSDGSAWKRAETELSFAKSLESCETPVLLGDFLLEPSLQPLHHKVIQEQKFAFGIINLIMPLQDKPSRRHASNAINRHFSLLSRHERNYQLFLFLDRPSHRSIIGQFLYSLPLSYATSLKILIYNNKELKFFCAHCHDNWYVALRPGLRSNRWYMQRVNLQGGIVYVVGLKRNEKCRESSRSSLAYIRHCAFEALQAKLNFSSAFLLYKQFMNQKQPQKTLTVVHGGSVSEEAYEKMESIPTLEWMITAELYSSCRIISVFHIRRTELYTAAMKTLDEVSWICLRSSACLTALILAFILNPEGGQTWKILSRTVAYVIDQGGLFNPKNWSCQARLVLSIWLLSLIVLVAGYKGVLYSLLTKPNRITAPSTLKELVEAKMPIFTLEEYFPSHKYRSSLLHHAIDEFLRKRSNANENAVNEGHLTKVLVELKSKLRFASARAVGGFASQRLFGALVGARGNESQVAAGDLDTYQGDHVLLGNELRIKTYFQLILVSGKRTGIQVSPELHVFIQRYPTLVERNLFAKVLTYGMFQLVESGCWQRWEEEHRHAVMLREIYSLYDYSLFGNDNLPTLGNPSAVFFSEKLKIQGFTCTKDVYENLSLENFRGPFLFLVYSLFAVFMILILEKIVHCHKR